MTTDTALPAITPPSFVGRALTALGLLVGFYLLTFVAAAFLIAVPVVAFFVVERLPVFAFLMLVVACWVAGVSMLISPLSVRPPAFRPPGPKLDRDDAPELFSMLDELGAASGVAPPNEIFLSTEVNACVLDQGGLFTRRRRRILVLGIPLVEMFTTHELRAVLAHELGHFAGGDTRLSGVLGYTVAAFRSVAESTTRGAFSEGSQNWIIEGGLTLAQGITTVWVRAYATVFFGVTGASRRRQELAADSLAARVVGRQATASALRTSAIERELFEAYAATEVKPALALGSMPSDLIEGYLSLRRSSLASPLGETVTQAVLEAPAEKGDAHPTLPDRLRALGYSPTDRVSSDGPQANTLFAAPHEHRAWVAQAMLSQVNADLARGAQLRSRAEIARDHATPAARDAARKLAGLLHPYFPQATTQSAMLAAVVPPFFLQGPQSFFATVDPRVPPGEALTIGAIMLRTLLEGALLEHGAEVIPSETIGGRTLRLGDENVDPNRIVATALEHSGGRAPLRRWMDRLSGVLT